MGRAVFQGRARMITNFVIWPNICPTDIFGDLVTETVSDRVSVRLDAMSATEAILTARTFQQSQHDVVPKVSGF